MPNRTIHILLGFAVLGVVTTEALAVQYARPDDTNSAGSWTYSGASSLHEAVDETSPDDADYMSATSDTTAELSLSSITDPVVHTGHVIRFRVLSIGGGAKERCQVQLHDGASPIASSAAEQSRDVYGTFTYTLLEAEATNISSYANLSVRIVSSSVGGGEEVRVSWVEFEVPDATGATTPTVILPTVTAVDTNFATLGATVDSNGGAAVTDRGNAWDTNPDPNTSDNQVSEGSGTGFFTHVVSPLPSGSLIYYKGYAINSEGTGYSVEDSFYTEPSQATNVSFTNVQDKSMTITWTRGNGDGSIVLVKEGSIVDSDPVDGTAHIAGTLFKSGDQLGTGNYVVFRGDANQVTVTGLTASTDYWAAVYEYAGSGSAINYQQDTPADGNQATIESQGSLGHNDAQTIYCDYCHSMHSGLLPTGTGQDALCKSCHNEGGLAAETSDVNSHIVNGGSTRVDCGYCHEVHNYYDFNTVDTHPSGVTAENLSYIRWDTAKYVAAANEPAVYHDPNVQAFSESPWNGMCQTCHTSTGNHRNDGTGDQTHEMTNPDNCTSCHTHSGGFEPIGGSGCISCHDEAQDANDGAPTRAAMVADFNQLSHHVADGNVTDADCEVCHYEAVDGLYHKNNLVDLRNPDTGSPITGFATFYRENDDDFSNEPWVTNVQNNFCLKCHDSNGAVATAVDTNTPLRPFSVGDNNVPNVSSQFDTGNFYHHPVKGPGDNVYCIPSPNNSNTITMESPWNQDSTHDQISCFDCHVTTGHGDPNQRMLLAAIDFNTMEEATVKTDLPSGMGDTVEAFCIRCHKSTVYVSGNTGSVFEYHGTDQSQHGSAGGNELGCLGCHGGTVELTDQTYWNGSAKGNIHGGSFTWPADAWTPNEPTTAFLVGGWLDGYQEQGNWSNKDGWWEPACGGGKCQHSGGTKFWTPVSD